MPIEIEPQALAVAAVEMTGALFPSKRSLAKARATITAYLANSGALAAAEQRGYARGVEAATHAAQVAEAQQDADHGAANTGGAAQALAAILQLKDGGK